MPENERKNWFLWTLGSIAVGCIMLLLSPFLITEDLERHANQGRKSRNKEVGK